MRSNEAKEHKISIEIHQQDFMPGWAAYVFEDGKFNPKKRPVALLNVGSLLAAIESGELQRKDLPYMIAESLMHEVIHVLEHWANVEFSEKRVEALLAKYRNKYRRRTVWQFDAKRK